MTRRPESQVCEGLLPERCQFFGNYRAQYG